MSLQTNAAALTFDEIREALGAQTGPQNGEICGVVTDSRELRAGNLFVPLVGAKFDGHDFLESAKQLGAHTLSSRENSPHADFFVPDTLVALGDLARFHRRKFEIPVVGITGSYGKTTTRALTFAALGAGFSTLTSQGNFNNEIGVPMTLFQLDDSHEAAVLEMGMRGLGQIEYLAKIAAPTIGIVTNIGPQHIELLGTEENIARAKSEIIENLPANGLAVLPADSPFIEFLISKAPGAYVLFGHSPRAHFRVQNVRTDEVGNVKFEICVNANPSSASESSISASESSISASKSSISATKSSTSATESSISATESSTFASESSISASTSSEFESISAESAETNRDSAQEKSRNTFEISLPMPGAHNALNAAAAFAAAYCLEIRPEAIVAALSRAQIPGARMRVFKTATGATVIDDCYNAGPDSTRAALQTLLDFPGSGRKIAVLGEMRELGEFSEIKHREIGELAALVCDHVVGVGGQTRPLLNQLLETARQNEREVGVHWCEDAASAREIVQNFGENGDVILVKGSRGVALEVVVAALENK